MVCPERILQYIDVPAEGTPFQLTLFQEENDEAASHTEKAKTTSTRVSGTNNCPGVTLPRESWPTTGVIEFQHVWFRYQPIEDVFEKLQAKNSRGEDSGSGCVLRNLHFKTTSREKIGIV